MTKTDTTRLYLTNVPAHVATRVSMYVYWRSAWSEERVPDVLVTVCTVGDVLDVAWTERVPHYRSKYNNGHPFQPVKRLPRGRRGTSIRLPKDYTSLTISSIKVDIADEMRGMVVHGVTHGLRDIENLGLIAGDAIDKWLATIEKKHHNGIPFGEPGR